MRGRLILAAAGIAALATPAFADIGRVKRTVGDAQVIRAGRAIKPVEGTPLEGGDVLKTGASGRISVTFADNTRFSAGPNSAITLTKFLFDKSTRKGEFLTTVDRGSLAVVSGQIAHEDKKAMKIKTPTALLGIRGTFFILDVKPQ